jgi:hypothetical protein
MPANCALQVIDGGLPAVPLVWALLLPSVYMMAGCATNNACPVRAAGV